MAKISVGNTSNKRLRRVTPCFENPARSKDLPQTVITISNFFWGSHILIWGRLSHLMAPLGYDQIKTSKTNKRSVA